MLELLKQRAEPRGLANIRIVLAEQDDPGLPEQALDLVLMVDVYHELSSPPPVLAAVYRSLQPTGRLVLVEFREEDPEVPIKPLHKMSQKQIVKELSANGFKLTGQYDGLPWQHVLFFSRNDSPAPATQLIPWDSASRRRAD
jgi:ubiquinone/menaquinone biosynthesis C-methylase UbiE